MTNACRTQIQVDFPARGATIQDFAHILDLVLEGFDISGLIDPSTVVVSEAGYDAYVKGIDNRINDISADLEFDCTNVGCFFLGFVSTAINATLVDSVECLYAAWRAGWLELEAGPELLGDADLGALGVTGLSPTLSGLLAPTLSDCNDEGTLRAHLGDLERSDRVTVIQGSL